jgi:hypothetical protein
VRLLALDLGNRCGFATGEAGGKPRVESWILKTPKQTPEVACRNLACSLRDEVRSEKPDVIVVEAWMHPAAQPSADVIITHMQLHGAVEAVAGCFGIRTERPTSAQYRKHFCGQSTAGARRPPAARTPQMRQADRRATNDMVLRRAILLGYLPADSTDWDRAAAVALWDFGCAHFARRAPAELVLFGEQARAAP